MLAASISTCRSNGECTRQLFLPELLGTPTSLRTLLFFRFYLYNRVIKKKCKVHRNVRRMLQKQILCIPTSSVGLRLHRSCWLRDSGLKYLVEPVPEHLPVRHLFSQKQVVQQLRSELEKKQGSAVLKLAHNAQVLPRAVVSDSHSSLCSFLPVS